MRKFKRDERRNNGAFTALQTGVANMDWKASGREV
jgi:hypothetical protein